MQPSLDASAKCSRSALAFAQGLAASTVPATASANLKVDAGCATTATVFDQAFPSAALHHLSGKPGIDAARKDFAAAVTAAAGPLAPAASTASPSMPSSAKRVAVFSTLASPADSAACFAVAHAIALAAGIVDAPASTHVRSTATRATAAAPAFNYNNQSCIKTPAIAFSGIDFAKPAPPVAAADGSAADDFAIAGLDSTKPGAVPTRFSD